MQRWEWTDVWVPLAIKTREATEKVGKYGSVRSMTIWAEHDLDTKQARAEAKKLTEEGWELVAVIPRFKAFIIMYF